MKELKEGMYVRTKEGYIAKLLHYGYNTGIAGKSHLFDSQIRDISYLVYEEDNFLWDSDLKVYIKKYSYNPIDLIEDGDYVNGYKIVYIRGIKHIITENGVEFFGIFHINDIKSIVTKEQFESMSYKVDK